MVDVVYGETRHVKAYAVRQADGAAFTDDELMKLVERINSD